MNQKHNQNLLYVLMTLILVTAGAVATLVGNRTTSYKDLDDLLSITKLSIPLQKAVTELQEERDFSGMVLITQRENFLSEMANQFASTDRVLSELEENLNRNKVLLLDIQPEDVQEVTRKLKPHRNRIAGFSLVPTANFDYYTFLINDFVVYLEKMYEFGKSSASEVSLKGLLHLVYYKEHLSRERGHVSIQLSEKNVPPGEVVRIKKMLQDQESYLSSLLDFAGRKLKEKVEIALNSPEFLQLKAARKRFEDPLIVKGGADEATEYYTHSTSYLEIISRIEMETLAELNSSSEVESKRLIEEIIWIVAIGLGAILILVGLYILLRKKNLT